MKRFCVITNRDKEDSNQKALYIQEYLEQKGGKCCILENRRVISEGVLHIRKQRRFRRRRNVYWCWAAMEP